ncbi:helix-turn-helix transcriptional regulator [Microvirga sp. STR05]|uniref:Helix-turn-helix transcriptional regulator n=1 Tax=Hymenobacter duratus TaxID=2771356 RepID=A0ABR8JGY0_9BACT|nr:helix-turn-helix transcriptional regulator [Hymenobacter duratus]MBR7951014.1 helix-turn-helix transcriptional regulator [Microvirga sp. STR05]
MVERIRTLLEARQLTPTQFADAIGVARPIVSHIMSGRNKPSLEVVQKIIAAFPDIALPWLLTGAGTMAAEPASGVSLPSAPALPPAPARRSILKAPKPAREAQQGISFGNGTAEQVTSAPVAASSTATEALPPSALNTDMHSQAAIATATVPATVGHGNNRNEGATAVNRQAPASELAMPSESSLVAQVADKGKAIRRIVIFYRDGTFTDYQPEG